MNTSLLPLLLTILPSVTQTLVSASISGSACASSNISVRIPPYLDPALNTSSRPPGKPSPAPSQSFLAPPSSFLAGTWYQTNSSLPSYRNLSNLQWDLSPVIASCAQNPTTQCPPGTLAGAISDLTTWALGQTTVEPSRYDFGALGAGNRPVASLFSHDTPIRMINPGLGPGWDGVYVNRAIGGIPGGYSEDWSVIYWGTDARGEDWMVVHESDPACVDAFSRNPMGPERESLEEVMGALRELRDEGLTCLVDGLGPVEWDHALADGAAVCGEKCRRNGGE